MKLKVTTTLLVVGILFCLLCFSYADRDADNQAKGINELIKDKKAQSAAAHEQQGKESDKDDEIEEALAELFSKMLEEQVEAQAVGREKKVAESEGFFSFFHKIGNFFRRMKQKFKKFGRKVKRFFHRRRG